MDDNGYEEAIIKFIEAFNGCHDAWGLPETLKIHILEHHVGDYLAMEGITCWSTNDELVESCHALLERRNLRLRIFIG